MKSKLINGFNNYLLYENGIVYSLKKKINLKPLNHKNGYLYYDLRHNKIRKLYYIHKLIADHFIENPQLKPMVNHIDGNKKNNSINNLEWVTSKENVNHAVKMGLMNFRGEKHPMSKLKIDQVNEIRNLLKEGKFTQNKIASMYNVTRGCIQGIQRNKNWNNL